MANEYPALTIANFFIEKGIENCRPVTQMQLHKLIYFAHGWNLAINSTPLISEDIQAWKFGPVIPIVYHAFKEFGALPITRPTREVTEEFESVTPAVPASDTESIALLDRIWKVYGGLSAVQLSEMSHEPGGPWENTVKDDPDKKHKIIPKTLIQEFFTDRAKANAGRRETKSRN